MTIENSKISDLRVQLEIAASVENVWAGLTTNIGAWWPAEFYAGGDPGAREFHLQAEPGGKMMETWHTGGGVLWGNVVMVEPNVRLQILGATFPNWGGPQHWFGTWDLASKAGTTLLTFSEHAVGRTSESGTAEKDKGWVFLWATLKAHVEGTRTPKWTD